MNNEEVSPKVREMALITLARFAADEVEIACPWCHLPNFMNAVQNPEWIEELFMPLREHN